VKCSRCEHENPSGAKFCEECAAPLARTCLNCGTQLSATAKFCPECAHPVAGVTVTQPRFTSPGAYTPKHLAEKILTSKSALEGERKQVTVLFADMKGSMELMTDRDPEDARKLLDPILEHMMEAVHRYEGTVNQVMGDAQDAGVRETVCRGSKTDRGNSPPDKSGFELRRGCGAVHRE
jgi:Double zinc ribbon/Adenylate and Guanylate cyclase catalytic domain